MRYKFVDSLLKIVNKDKKTVFLTGDLGFNTFEGLRDDLGERFINAGVAEHNMVTVAAGLAYAGFKPWIYSIAPFVTIKVLEEIRNDVCLPNFNIKIVGSGGGFDYGIAGPTHHSLQDIATLMSLPNLKIYAPGFKEDIAAIVDKISNEHSPSYLRLVKAETSPVSVSKYAAIRRILSGDKIVVVVLGSMINKVLQAAIDINKKITDVWLVSELPITEFPEGLITAINKTKKVCVVEEHVQTGGLGHYFHQLVFNHGIRLDRFIHLFAKGYISRYGSRDFYLKESGLDEESILKAINSLL